MRRLLLLMLAVFVLCSQLLAQNRTISGRITDAQGNGVPNASVTVKGTNQGTTTGSDGSFSLTVSEKARTLVVSSVGFQNQELSIGNRTTIETSLVSVDQTLSEVVVTVPYGTVKKTAFTGSEATINAKTLGKQQVTSVTRALEGQIPGLISTNGGGAPGAGASVVVRGFGSLNATSAPLYLVNGVVYDGSISALNMDEIESVTVLKDAAATALMGARAANGIIMITTKTGKKGKPQVTATARHGFMTRGIPEYDRVGPKEYYELMWEAIRNSYVYRTNSTDNMQTAGVKASNELISNLVYNAYNVPNNQLVDPVTGKLNPNAQLMWNDSWEDALYQTAQRKNYTFNVAGAGDRSDYYLSAGYLDEEGILKFSGYKRYNTRLTLNTDATKWLRAGINLDGSLVNQANVPSGGTATTNPFYFTRQMGPIYPVYQRNAQGNYVPDPATGGNMLDWGRPSQTVTGLARPYAPNANLLGSLELDDRSSKVFNGNANPYAEIRFLKDFSFKTTLGVNLWNSYATTYQNSQFGDADNVKGRSTKSSGRQVSYTLNEVLTWNKRFGDHSVRVLAGHENYKYIYNQVSTTRTGFPFPGTSELDNASVTESSGSYEDNHRIESWFAGGNYEFMNKYLLSASVRRDGSSRFHPDNRWGTFYAAGAGWRISKEAFMQGIDWLNELKLKASYGEQGNEGIGQYYAYQNLYEMGWNNAARSGAVMSTVPGNPDLIWEGNQTFNAGFDFAVLKNRLTGTVEYFNRASDDLLFDVTQAPSLGIAAITKNIGKLVNKGVDLQLGYNAIRTKNFDWRIDLTATHIVNEITKMPPTQPEIVSGVNKYTEGHSIYDFWLREYAGVDAATGKELYYRDVMGSDGKPTGQRVLTDSFSKASFYYSGSAIPDFSGGVTNSFRYKGFDLSFLVTFSKGGKFLDQNYQSLMHFGSYGTAWHTDIQNRWQKPGDVTNVPRIQNAIGDNGGTSTRFLFDGSYLNVKNITLSYTLPSSIFQKVGIAGIQVFGNVDNAYLFSTRKGMDPQRSFGGTSDWSYVPYRTFTFGLTSNF